MCDDYSFIVYTIFTMLLVFVASVIGIGLMLEIVLSNIGLPWFGLLIGIIIGLFVDYNIYQIYKE